MIRLAADESLKGAVVRALRRRKPDLDLARVQDVGLAGAGDDEVLEWAAREGRIVITRDVRTMPSFAYERVQSGRPMPGVLVVSRDVAVGQTVADLLLLIECLREGEWEDQVHYLPI